MTAAVLPRYPRAMFSAGVDTDVGHTPWHQRARLARRILLVTVNQPQPLFKPLARWRGGRSGVVRVFEVPHGDLGRVRETTAMQKARRGEWAPSRR